MKISSLSCVLSMILLTSFAWASSYDYEAILQNNPVIKNRLNFLKDVELENEVTIAVLGDYVHTDVFSHLIDINEKEIENNHLDDDGNGYVDDYYGMNFDEGNAPLNSPVINGHENGIVSLIDAFSRGNGIHNKIKILPVNIVIRKKGFDPLYLKRIADAIDYARKRGAQVISMSFGFSMIYEGYFKFINDDRDKSHSYFKESVKRALDEGILLVAASSNDNSRNQATELQIPASSEGVLSVSNTTLDGRIQSAYGSNVDIAFYGNLYVWGSKSEGYRHTNGTSYATPLVALTLAVAKSLSPELNQKDSRLKNLLRGACEKPIVGKKRVASGCVYSPEKFILSIQ